MTARLEWRRPPDSSWRSGDWTSVAAVEDEVRRRNLAFANGQHGWDHQRRVAFDDPIAQACYDAVNPGNVFPDPPEADQ